MRNVPGGLIWMAVLAFFYGGLTTRAQVRSDGYIDPTFGSFCLTNPSPSVFTRAVAVQPDGRVLAGGNFRTPAACANAIVRLRSDGTTDPTFGSPFFAGDFVNVITPLSNGRILVGGNMRDAGSAFSVARLNANGSLDNSFLRSVSGLGISVNALAVQADNRIVAAGYDFTTAPNLFGRLFRLNADGSVESFSTFASGTTSFTGGSGITALALQSGKIIAGGSFTTYTSAGQTFNRDGIVRLNANGTVDASFNPFISNSDIWAILVLPDDRILVAGQFTVDGFGGRMLTLLNANGSRDPSFTSVNGAGATGLALALEPSGKIVLGHSFGVMRLNPNGTVDSTFGPRNDALGFGTDAANATAFARSEGNLIVGAQRVTVASTTRGGIARLFSNVPSLPVILTNPVSMNVEAGANVTFSVIATGAPPVRYQWRKTGKDIKNATNSTLSLFNVNSTHAGNYQVVVSNPGGVIISGTARLSVSFHTSPLDLSVEGNGSITPNLDGKQIEIGRTFTLTAKPAPGHLFSHWSGFENTNSPVLTFVMQSNEVLRAHFVPSPFIGVEGIYSGLFFDTDSPAHENAGSFNLTLDGKGGFKGAVQQGAKARKFGGSFSLNQTADVALPASAADPALHLSLQIDTASGRITGLVSNRVSTAALNAERNPFTSAVMSPFAGNYNVVFPSAGTPAGSGFGTLKVSSNGKVSGRGTLADRSAWKVISTTAVDGRVPVYVSLYRGGGSLFGWLSLINDNGNTGIVRWTKPGSVGGTFYPRGFTNESAVLSERYVPRPAGVPMLPESEVVIEVEGGDSLSFMNLATLGGDNKLAGDNGLSLTLVPAKGTLSGTFLDPLSGKKRSLKGVVLPGRNEAHGLFFGTDESGRVTVHAAP